MADSVFNLGFNITAAVGSLLSGCSAATTSMNKLAQAGERMSQIGERLTQSGFFAKEGIENIRRLSDSLQEPAMNMQRTMAMAAAMTNLTTEQLNKLQEHAEDFAATHPALTAEEYIDGFRRMKGIFQDFAMSTKAMDLADMLAKIGVSVSTSSRLMQAGFVTLHTDVGVTADEVAKAGKVFGLQTDQMNQMATVASRLAPAVALVHGNMAELIATVGEANRMTGGGRGMMMFSSAITQLGNLAQHGKITLDVTHGLMGELESLRKQVMGGPMETFLPRNFYSLTAKAQEKLLKTLAEGAPGEKLAAFGLGNATFWLNLFAHMNDLHGHIEQVKNMTGALDEAHKAATNNELDQLKQLSNAWSGFGTAVFTPELHHESALIATLTSGILGATKVMKEHTTAALLLSVGLRGVGEGAHYALSAIQTLGSLALFGGPLLKLLGWGSAATTVAATAEGIAGAGAVAAAAPAAGAVLGGMAPELAAVGGSAFAGIAPELAGVAAPAAAAGGAGLIATLGLPVAVGAAAALAGYGFYKWLDAIRHYKPDVTTSDKDAASKWLGAPSASGVTGSWLGYLKGVVPATFGKIWEYIKPEVLFGKLLKGFFDAGKKLIIELAKGMYSAFNYPTEAIKSLGSTIMKYVMGHSPPELGPLHELSRIRIGETIAESILAGRPAVARAMQSTLAGASGGIRGGGGVIVNLNYSPTFNGAAPADFDARRHADQITDLIRANLSREARLSFY